jgi:hypothetical protein
MGVELLLDIRVSSKTLSIGRNRTRETVSTNT